MTKLFRIAAVLFAAVALLSVVGLLQVSAYAQDDQANAADPPSRVARLSYLSGNVSFQPNGVDDWGTAALNRPLTTSDRLWTERDARAELQIGGAAMRLSGETSFTLANLDDRRVQIQIAQGVLNVRLRQLDAEEAFEIDTPNFTLNLLRAGEYRIQVDNENDVSWVTVRSGSAEATGGADAVTVEPGQEASFSGSDGGTYEVRGAPGLDKFDQWCSARERRVESARSAEYVSRNVIGYEDLDDYGTWRAYEDYGQVWVPTVVNTGWAPYRDGHWAWIYPWGWTWVDDAPWGFAPFHYGRWVHAGFGWAWVPGPIYVRPVYAPALVAWCGGSGVGWFALGPREPFIPWYWGSQRYFSRVNYTNTRITNININNYYNNYYHPRWGDHDRHPERDDIRTIAHIDYANRNGMTFVDHDSFVNGRSVSRVAMRVPPENLRNAPVLTDIDAKPERRSVLGGHDDNARFRPPQKAFDRPFVSRDVPPKRLPFETQTKTFGTPRPVAKSVQTETPVSKPRWVVPKPGDDRRTTVDNPVREIHNQPPASNPVRDVQRSGQQENQRVSPDVETRQHVNVNNSRGTTTREVYRPPQEERVHRNPDPPQRAFVQETRRSPEPVQQRPPERVQQHSERAPETRQDNSNTIHSNQGGDRGGNHTQQGSSPNQGRRPD